MGNYQGVKLEFLVRFIWIDCCDFGHGILLAL